MAGGWLGWPDNAQAFATLVQVGWAPRDLTPPHATPRDPTRHHVMCPHCPRGTAARGRWAHMTPCHVTPMPM
eukprot:4786538-Prymnesium_polylepis.2